MIRTLLTACTIAIASLPGAALSQSEKGDPSSIEEMVLGNADATLEVVEYASYTCPHCASFHRSAFKDIKKNYIDTGKIRFVYREVYFDRFGLWASMIARCGGKDRFFGISDMIYETQAEWTMDREPTAVVENLRRIGLSAGLSNDELDACLSDAGKAESLVAWFRENAEADGIQSTPSFIIDGDSYSNMSYDDFAKILDEKLNN